jgi:uracil-DNA glycosylase
VDKKPEGEAAEMMRNMLRAMGCSNRDSMVKLAEAAAAEKPRARVYIVLGSEAFRAFAPDQRAALGMWTKVADVPTVVTYSPAKALACFGSVGEGITKAKRQIWKDLRSALSLVGRAPVAARK